MRVLLIISLLLLSFGSQAQAYLEFKKLGLLTQQEQMDFVDLEIGIHSQWNARKIELYCLKSDLLNRVGDYEQSENVLKSIPLKEIYKNKGDYYLAQAVLKKYKKDFEDSYDGFKKAQTIFRREKKNGELANAFIEEAEFHRKYTQYQIGIACIDSARILINKYHCDAWLKIKMLNRHAAIANESDLSKRSCLDLSFEAVDLAKKEKAYYWLGVSYVEIGVNYSQINQTDSAIYYTDLAVTEFKSIGLDFDYVNAKFINSCLFTDISKTIIKLEEVVTYVNTKDVKFPLGNVYNRLGYCYNLIGNHKDALRCFKLENKLWRAGIQEDEDLKLAKIADDFNSVKLQSENDKIKNESRYREELIKRQQNQFFLILVFSIFLVILIIALSISSVKRKKLNKELNIKNQQKDLLIQEVHHRVKNNLQFVKSIILFQSTKQKENDQTLEDISRRIDAISLVHEMLYSKNDSNEISIKEYLEKLIQYSEELYNGEKQIQINLVVEDVFLPTEKLESLGIICSELLNNSMKHAFRKTEKPTFTINFSKIDNNTFLLHMFDNGSINDEIKAGLGLKMIDIYSRQLKGEYSLLKEDGFHYEIKFNIK